MQKGVTFLGHEFKSMRLAAPIHNGGQTCMVVVVVATKCGDGSCAEQHWLIIATIIMMGIKVLSSSERKRRECSQPDIIGIGTVSVHQRMRLPVGRYIMCKNGPASEQAGHEVGEGLVERHSIIIII